MQPTVWSAEGRSCGGIPGSGNSSDTKRVLQGCGKQSRKIDHELPVLNQSSVLVVNHIKATYELCEIEIKSGVTAEFRA
jgi:hypothetical protein